MILTNNLLTRFCIAYIATGEQKWFFPIAMMSSPEHLPGKSRARGIFFDNFGEDALNM
jgi:hypothetical protein